MYTLQYESLTLYCDSFTAINKKLYFVNIVLFIKNWQAADNALDQVFSL